MNDHKGEPWRKNWPACRNCGQALRQPDGPLNYRALFETDMICMDCMRVANEAIRFLATLDDTPLAAGHRAAVRSFLDLVKQPHHAYSLEHAAHPTFISLYSEAIYCALEYISEA